MKAMHCITAMMLLAPLAGCWEDKPAASNEEVRTVEWYRGHQPERQAMLEKCKNNPGELRDAPNCVNARAAKEWTMPTVKY
ncbi:MAG: EexN family lipoprotein [Azoarcus sp.]|jgi:hypothetical protein|nr:EexN family lipoprotein [Azoarcus sp.]